MQQSLAIAPPPQTDPSLPLLDPDVLDALTHVVDPEVGIGIVDLGLVYRATRSPEGVEVDMTLTTQACPMGEMLLYEARAALRKQFPGAADIAVRLVHAPAWTPDLITERGRALLGHRG